MRQSLQVFLQGLSLAQYIKAFGSVFDRETHTTRRFKLWPKQARLADLMEETPRCIVPKARQLGISEIAGEEVVKTALQYNRALILILSKTERDAIEFLETKIRPKIESLPKIKGITWPSMEDDTKTYISLSNGSRIISLPASNRSGASMVADMIVIDEAGGLHGDSRADLAIIYRNVVPTIEKAGKRGKLRIIGTSEPGSYFNQLVRDVTQGKKDLRCFFLPANADPNRTQEWMDAQKRNYPTEADFKSQYPVSLEDFFVVREGLIYPHFDPKEGGRHVMDFRVDGSMVFYVVYDHGFRHPAVLLEAYHDPHSDVLYVNNEWYWTDTRVELVAQDVKDIIDEIGRVPRKMIADSAIFAETGITSIASVFRQHGLYWTKSNKFGGKSIMDGSGVMLGTRFTQDKVVIHPRCVNLTQELMTWRWDENKKGAVPKDEHDDGIDCVVAGTLITMWNGTTKPVELVSAGDMVMTASGTWEVDVAGSTGYKEIFAAEYGGRALRASGGHRVLTTAGWVCMRDLEEGMYLVASEEDICQASYSTAESSARISQPGTTTVQDSACCTGLCGQMLTGLYRSVSRFTTWMETRTTTTASLSGEERAALTTRHGPAWYAATSTVSTSTQGPALVAVRVDGCRNTRVVEETFNLTIWGMPEYIANGVVVHNCLRYLCAELDAPIKPATTERARRPYESKEIKSKGKVKPWQTG